MPEKADGLVSDNVFLDTRIFVAEHYSSTSYRTLIRLGTMGAINLKITDITLGEISHQIEEKITEAVGSMLSRSSKTAILRNFEEYSDLMERFAAQKVAALAAELWSRVTQQLTEQVLRSFLHLIFRPLRFSNPTSHISRLLARAANARNFRMLLSWPRSMVGAKAMANSYT
jgi:hypothetical protein